MMEPSNPEVPITAQEIIPNFKGMNLVGLLAGASQDVNNALSKQTPSENHNYSVLWAHKAADRLKSAAEIIARSGQEISYQQILDHPGEYGLDRKDLPYLEKFVLSTNLVNSAIESKYGVMRVDNFRKHVIQNVLQEGGNGTLACVDLVALKEFNEISDVYGDQAITVVADFLKDLYREIDPSNEHPQLMIGRRGDEFYIFIKGVDANTFSQIMSRKLDQSKDKMQVNVQNPDTPQNKPVITYWRVADQVDVNNFDQSMIILNEAIEDAKLMVTNQTLEKIAESSSDPNTQYIHLLQLLASKRISIDIIQSLIKTGVESFRTFVDLTGDQESEILDSLKTQFSSDEIRQQFQRIISQITFDIEHPASHIVDHHHQDN